MKKAIIGLAVGLLALATVGVASVSQGTPAGMRRFDRFLTETQAPTMLTFQALAINIWYTATRFGLMGIPFRR